VSAQAVRKHQNRLTAAITLECGVTRYETANTLIMIYWQIHLPYLKSSWLTDDFRRPFLRFHTGWAISGLTPSTNKLCLIGLLEDQNTGIFHNLHMVINFNIHYLKKMFIRSNGLTSVFLYIEARFSLGASVINSSHRFNKTNRIVI
jgi:hypothetical protein